MSGRLDAPTLRRAMDLFARALQEHREELDSLNVFPVADGDTGTNMLLTQQSVQRALEEDGGLDGLGALCERIARSSLLAARGNSGVILSQVLRGICGVLARPADIDAAGFADALTEAADQAYQAVARPREGTVLSVLRDAAAAARASANASAADQRTVAGAALAAARESLARTTDQLPELRAAGVVDAGGLGVVLLLDALRAALTDASLTEPVGSFGPVGHANADVPAPDLAFEVQFLLAGDDGVLPGLREELLAIGDSLVVVGGPGLYNVHVHTDEPGRALDAGRRSGEIRDVRVVSLAEDVSACVAGQAREVRATQQRCGLVALVEGDGLVRAFASLGAVVVRGGPGAVPPVAAVVAGMDAVPASSVVLLAADPDLTPVAERAVDDFANGSHVVGAPSVVAALAGATAFDPEASAEENVDAMRRAVAETRAGRLVLERDGSKVWRGIGDDDVVAAGPDAPGAAVALAKHLMGDEAELVTLVAGAGAPDGEPETIVAALEHAFPELTVELIAGGQVGAPYVLGVD